MKREMVENDPSAQPLVIATGGLAPLIAEHSEVIDHLAPRLTLEGLRLIYERHRRSP